MFILYVCVSIPALLIGSLYHFQDSTYALIYDVCFLIFNDLSLFSKCKSVQHRAWLMKRPWGLQFSLCGSHLNQWWLFSCSVLSFPVWPEAWGGGLWDLQLQLHTLWFDHHCGTESLPESWPYFYICEESSRCLLARDHWTESTLPSFSRPLHQVTQSSPSWLCAQMRGQWIDGIIRNSRLGGHGPGASAVVGGTVPLWIPASLHIKASPVFSSVQENIWKICPVNSPLCSCLDFNIYLPIRSNIWWMPMGEKIRHYEKQRLFSPLLFLFFPNRFTSMRKSRRKSSRLYNVYSKEVSGQDCEFRI